MPVQFERERLLGTGELDQRKSRFDDGDHLIDELLAGELWHPQNHSRAANEWLLEEPVASGQKPVKREAAMFPTGFWLLASFCPTFHQWPKHYVWESLAPAGRAHSMQKVTRKWRDSRSWRWRI